MNSPATTAPSPGVVLNEVDMLEHSKYHPTYIKLAVRPT